MPPENRVLDEPPLDAPAAPTPAQPSLREFLAELLGEQQRLQTPVAQFAVLHDFSPSVFQSSSHSRLLPLTAPRAGEQYAFEVDLDACTGCKACVSACHALNGLDENETWRDTGQLLGGYGAGAPVVQTITSACHHCADPGCLNGCPVLAYEKDPVTGIVRHLDDQCIGCQYCVLKCPYGVPKYNARLGIVRKCDLCHQRLAVGEAPACTQACPTQAIKIAVVPTAAPRDRRASASSMARKDSRNGSPPARHSVAAEDIGDQPRLETPLFADDLAKAECPDGGASCDCRSSALPHQSAAEPKSANRKPKMPIAFPGPDPTYTHPTTRYVTAREFPSDARPADAAQFLPQPPHWPLVLMLTFLPWAILLQAIFVLSRAFLTLSAADYALAPLVLGATGLVAATFHLGQPLRAWRVFLGLRQSWFSREAVLFGAWFGTTAAATITAWIPALAFARDALEGFAGALGLAGLACSVMIYVDTRRRFWRAGFVAPRVFLGGAVLALTILAPGAAAWVLVLKLAAETASLLGAAPSARLQRGTLRPALGARFACAAVGAGLLAWWPTGALVALLAGEIAERYLFFRAVDVPKMPGYAAAGGPG